MKLFTTLRLHTLLVSASLSILSVASAAVTQIPKVEYEKLLDICNKGGPNAYVGVRFGDDNYTSFKFDQCYPYEINGQQAQMAVFCRSATCYDNPNPDCSGGATPPVGIPVTKGLTLVNAADWVQFLGQGALCHRNGLSAL